MKQSIVQSAVGLLLLHFAFTFSSCHTEPLPIKQSTDWTLLQSTVTYTPDNSNEQSRIDNIYDNQNRLVGSSNYSLGSITSKTRDYIYSYKSLSYYDESYNAPTAPPKVSFIKIKYIDVLWTCPDTIITYNQDGTQELNRTENTYDNQYRLISSTTYTNKLISSIIHRFNYIDKYTYTYTKVNFSNGIKTDSISYKAAYFDENHLKLKEYITYGPDGVNEDSKIENTYDELGRLNGSAGYNKGNKMYVSHDFVYNGKELNFYTDSYKPGNPIVTNHNKYIYYK